MNYAGTWFYNIKENCKKDLFFTIRCTKDKLILNYKVFIVNLDYGNKIFFYALKVSCFVHWSRSGKTDFLTYYVNYDLAIKKLLAIFYEQFIHKFISIYILQCQCTIDLQIRLSTYYNLESIEENRFFLCTVDIVYISYQK